MVEQKFATTSQHRLNDREPKSNNLVIALYNHMVLGQAWKAGHLPFQVLDRIDGETLARPGLEAQFQEAQHAGLVSVTI
ncbi:MAG: hypothetical protein IIC89_03855 [Chloroflexi bacterium]|nr:hypothetical protein [Chloroflexota bacterium]